MNYDEMSDFEINKAVALAIGLQEWGEQWLDLADGDESLFLVASESSREVLAKDYCNNPSDIMPIAIEHKIDLMYAANEFWHAGVGITGARYVDKNPYRAIAICFLKMMESK